MIGYSISNSERLVEETDETTRSSPLAMRAVRIARSWIGTPYIHQASVKGVGCDCLGLLRGVWRELFGAEPESMPAYSPDWAEATGEETLYKALSRHAREIGREAIAPGDIVLFRMLARGPAKHCGVVGGKIASPFWGGGNAAHVSGGGPGSLRSPASTRGEGETLTLIHARQNKRVSEEPFTAAWQRRLAYVFTLAPAGGEGRVRGCRISEIRSQKSESNASYKAF